jgi:CrcB protein
MTSPPSRPVIVLYVALGSALGGVSRYLLSGVVQAKADTSFPVGTLLVNVTGSFLLGFLARYGFGANGISPEGRLLLTAGFCGGYTTFSTFSLETLQLLEQGSYGKAATYAGTSLVVSLTATIAGAAMARALTE